MRKKILVTMLLILVIASTVFTGCAKKQAPATTNGLDGDVAQGISEVDTLNQNLTDTPTLDNDMANVQDSLNKW